MQSPGLLIHPAQGQKDSGWPCAVTSATLRSAGGEPGHTGQQETSSPLTSVCFAGVDSLEVFIFFWGWEVFDGMKGIFGFKVICREGGNRGGSGSG